MNIVCLRKWIKLERGILYMGKASYRPKRNQNRNEMEKKRDIKDKMVDMPIQDEEGHSFMSLIAYNSIPRCCIHEINYRP